MKNEFEKQEQKDRNENEKNEKSSDSEEENEEQEDVDSGVKLDQFITTPYERVLSIINEAKAFIISVSKDQQALIKGLEWSIKVISSHSLYSYELKDQDYLDQMGEDNPDFKQFVDFVNSYNDQFIDINRKSVMVVGNSALNTKRGTTRKNSMEEESKKIEKEKKQEKEKKKNKVEENNNKTNDDNNIILKAKSHKSERNLSQKTKDKSKETIDVNRQLEESHKKGNIKEDINKKKSKKKSLLKLLKHSFSNDIAVKIENPNSSTKTLEKIVPTKSHKTLKNFKSNSVIKKRTIATSKPKNSQKNVIYASERRKKSGKNLSIPNLDAINIFKQTISSMTVYSSVELEKALLDINYNTNRILTKTFNIFELREIVGQDNVLPIMGKTILDAFGLYSDDIIVTSKLDPFLVCISNQYLHSTLYHNSMHGADVTQTVCLFFLNSNAEEVCQSLVLDLLGILIAALGHDLGHPGLTNPYHINASSELALTYNDASCLENFHVSSLFKTIRNPKYDIFEKLEVADYKAIRRRMIGNILATDMANHGKIMTVIKSKISLNMAENKSTFELLSGNEKTKFEEQQSLFDFMLHSADLAHNCKQFNISLKWVELLSEEFWLQGDKEKSMNLPVSFLCDRDSYDIPKSQIGFIQGFVIPTYETLVNAFPSLDYTLKNAKTNLHRWQRLSNKGRKKGWTPEKTKQINYNKKLSLFNSISSINENPKIVKRNSGLINSLSHELQIKEGKTHKEEKKENHQKYVLDNNKYRPKIARPNIITKTKNHDKKVHINKIQKIK